MAIYHLHAQVISRGKGRSAIAAAAYRAAETIRDDRTGLVHSYERKTGVEHKEIMAPEGVPAWVHNRAELWNQVEAAENRKDAQVAREMVVALPVELNHEQQVELLRDFVSAQFVKKGMVADLNVHRDNPDNPHAHIMLTMRTIGPDGFGQKVRGWNSKEQLMDWREEWAMSVNAHLMKAQQQVRIDHRSFADQGIELTPSVKLGISADRHATEGRDIIRERLAKHDEIARSNGEAIEREPRLALDAITRQRATFSQADVARWLNPRTLDAEQFAKCMSAVLSSDEVVRLGKEAKGQERFTTREMLEVEQNLVAGAKRLSVNRKHEVAEGFVTQAERNRSTLSDEQRAMVRHVVRESGDLAVVQGVAGAGKSFALATAREAWEAQGYRVLGAALAGKAAEGLEVSSGIASRSIHAWEHAWQHDRNRLTGKDVLVIDEAGMVGSRQMQRVLAEVERAGAKVVLVGDIRQLQAIEAGAPMRAIADQVGQVVLGEVRRQEGDWQRKASEDLAKGQVAEALDAYGRAGHIHKHMTQQGAIETMVARWAANRQANPKELNLMLAFRRGEVRALNEAARSQRHLAGELGPDQLVVTEQGERHFAQHERVVFLKNDRLLGVMNGSLGTVEGIRGHIMTVRLDGADHKQVVFDVREYKHLDHGYAVTVHKAQGVTADRVQVLASEYFDQHVAYVALSRHRKQVELHWSEEAFRSREEMVGQLGRERMKDVALDYKRAEKQAKDFGQETSRKAPDPVQSLDRAVTRAPVEQVEKKHAAVKSGLVREKLESMDRKELARLVGDLRQLVKTAPLSQSKAFDQLPEVVKARADELALLKMVDQRTAQLEQWQKDHPIKAKLGSEPTYQDRDGQRVTLSEGLQRAEKFQAKAEAIRERVEKDPALQAKAEAMSKASVERWHKANRLLPMAEQVLSARDAARVREIMAERQKARELGKEADRGIGRERGFELGSDKDDGRGGVGR